MSLNQPIIISLTVQPIGLGQLLKLANVVQNGHEAKLHIHNGEVRVNGVVETRRGRKLVQGDQVVIGDMLYQVACS